MNKEDKIPSENIQEEQYETLKIGGAEYKTLYTRNYKDTPPYQKQSPKKLTAFIPGTIREVYKNDGDKVEKGDVILVLEAMKMRNEIIAPFDGEIDKIHVEQGKIVAKDELLVEMK